MQPDYDEDAYDKKSDAIRDRVETAFPDGLVEFSAFPEDDNGLPVDVLDELAVDGPVVFTAKHDPFFGSGKDYVSNQLNSPTWMEVVAVANDAVQCTGDRHHIYLEGVENTGKLIHGCKVFSLSFGS
jgi:hypothetical protein